MCLGVAARLAGAPRLALSEEECAPGKELLFKPGRALKQLHELVPDVSVRDEPVPDETKKKMTETRIRDLGAKSHLDALLATVGKVGGSRVVDIGCGEGQMARALAALGVDVTGYDPFIEGTEPVAHGAGRFRLVKAGADAIPNRIIGRSRPVYLLAPSRAGREARGRARRGAADLRPAGRLYVAEPLPQGPHQYVMELFHDDTGVPKRRQQPLRICATALRGR